MMHAVVRLLYKYASTPRRKKDFGGGVRGEIGQIETNAAQIGNRQENISMCDAHLEGTMVLLAGTFFLSG